MAVIKYLSKKKQNKLWQKDYFGLWLQRNESFLGDKKAYQQTAGMEAETGSWELTS